jgi:hypothetical protein
MKTDILRAQNGSESGKSTPKTIRFDSLTGQRVRADGL